jgi:hypothetical protein
MTILVPGRQPNVKTGGREESAEQRIDSPAY